MAAHGAEVQLRADRYAAAVHGTVLVTGLIAALSERHADSLQLAEAVFATMAVFYLAHVWSDIVGERAASGERLGLRRVLAIGAREWPMLESAAVPLVVLVVGALGAWSTAHGVTIGLVVCVLQLFAWGLVMGLRARQTLGAAVVAGAVDAALGMVLVLLKISIH